jgi:hypothetical protein
MTERKSSKRADVDLQLISCMLEREIQKYELREPLESRSLPGRWIFLRRSVRHFSRWAKLIEHASAARRLPCITNASSVNDQSVRKASPFVGREEAIQVALNFAWILLAAER